MGLNESQSLRFLSPYDKKNLDFSNFVVPLDTFQMSIIGQTNNNEVSNL